MSTYNLTTSQSEVELNELIAMEQRRMMKIILKCDRFVTET